MIRDNDKTPTPFAPSPGLPVERARHLVAPGEGILLKGIGGGKAAPYPLEIPSPLFALITLGLMDGRGRRGPQGCSARGRGVRRDPTPPAVSAFSMVS